MGIGIVSDEDFFKELEHSKKKESHTPHTIVPNVEIIDIPNKGRKEGDVNVPDTLRQIIAEEQLVNGRQSAVQLGEMFGVSASSVSAYANGATSTDSYNSPKPSIINHLSKARAKAIRRASKTLNGALGAITQEKLDYATVTDLSGIAKDMSVIIKNLEPPVSPSDTPQTNQPQFVIFAPTFRDERSYEHITVQE